VSCSVLSCPGNKLTTSSSILRYWDLRLPAKKSRSTKPKNPPTIVTSPLDPTALNSRRPRGITSMTLGTGPSSGLIFAVGADSNVHSYSLPSLAALPNTLTHPEMQTNSFYVQNSISPCGRWLASGSTGSYGDLYLFDVSNVARMGSSGEGEKAVRLGGQQGEIGAVDWADGCVASCADDGTVRIWRPDLDVRAACWERPQEWKWHWSWAPGS
jgi:denticleless